MEKPPIWSQRLKYERVRRGWSQEKLAQKIGSTAKTILRWERGLHLPTPELKQQLALVFETSIEALGLLTPDQEKSYQAEEKQNLSPESKEDWGEAPRRQQIYGREQELLMMEDWIGKTDCRIIALVGMGGVGKTTLAVELAKRVRPMFEYIFWRSLKNAPPLKRILEECIEFLTRQQPGLMHFQNTLAEEELLALLLTLLRHRRCLLILDNFESVVQPGMLVGLYRKEYGGYGEFLRRFGEAEQPGCLILTSREKPNEIFQLINDGSIHSLSPGGLNEEAGNHLLKAEQLIGTDTERKNLVQRFSGNPLALKLIAEAIRELFSNEITAFLSEGEAIFGGVQHLLEQQFERLSILEQELLYNLTIEREAVSLHDLQSNMVHSVSRSKIIEALESLRHRSLIERGNSTGSFTLQPVIMEYITERLIEKVCHEIIEYKTTGEEAEENYMASSIEKLPWHLTTLPLVKVEAKDYLQNTQMLLIIEPIVARLRATYGEPQLLVRLQALLERLRKHYPQHPGYLAGNILKILIALRIDLRGFDFSQLYIRQVDLRGIVLHNVDFSRANISNSLFNDTFSTIFCVVFSPDGLQFAAGSSSGEIRLWQAKNAVPLLTCQGHSDWIRSIAFNPNGSLLVSGGGDRALRIWNTSSGRCLMVLEGHTGPVRAVSFSSDGEFIASGSEDGTIRLWKTGDGACLKILTGHRGWVRSVAFNPVNSLLVSAGEDQTVRLWNWPIGQILRIFHGHNAQVRAATFSPDGVYMASAGDDNAIRIWDIQSARNIRTLYGHFGHV
ncbi:MAG TPA: NB-ARC domain-containing protein, partial [Ktedonobacteraceae bacterium]|nr:NB-ARC domain-containing protein [Ktedonobacteraceae bacterium]